MDKTALEKSYPYHLAGKPVATNTDLKVSDKYSGKRAIRGAFADAAAVRKAIVAAHKVAPALPGSRTMPAGTCCSTAWSDARSARKNSHSPCASRPASRSRTHVARSRA